MPIYYVIMEQKMLPGAYVSIWDILKVIECDLEDAPDLWNKEVEPLYQNARRIQVMYFYREPANPIKEKVQ